MKFVLVLLLAAALLMGCTGNASQGSGGDLVKGGKTVEITVTAKNWQFDPNVITVKKGDTVKLTLSSIQGTHGFSLPAYNINVKLVEGATPTIVEFVADKEGTFDFRCSIMCGAGHMQQKGKLIVEP